MKLAVVVGHEQKAQGAVSVSPLLQTEYVFNSDLARIIKGMSQSRGVSVKIFMRDVVGLRRCYEQVCLWEADAVVELHFNSFKDPVARGTETLAGEDAESKEWARYLQFNICDALGRVGKEDRGVKDIPNSESLGERGWFNVNSVPGVPNALIEPFFGSNPGDAALAFDRRVHLAAAVLDAFIGYYRRSNHGLARRGVRGGKGDPGSGQVS
jgi:N-acetylmuramoyl-L-alanine amidase